MDEPKTQHTEIPDKKFEAIPCGKCDQKTRHKILAETRVTFDYGNDLTPTDIEYQIIQCQGCLTISFCESSELSDDDGFELYGNYYPYKHQKFFPNRITGRRAMRESYLLPQGVQQIYDEAHSAICAELQIMAGFGIRAIIETVCKDKGMVGNNLKDRIDALAKAGFVTAAGADILHHLRFMGNAAAHEMKAHSSSEMNAAFDVIEHLLQGVYILPKQTEMLPKEKS